MIKIPHVAVILPYHEDMAPYIEKTIQHIFEQTDVFIRAYIIHNGEKKSAYHKVSTIIKDLNVIHLHSNLPSVTNARNMAMTAINNARVVGMEFDAVAFCDADDRWDKDHLIRSLTTLSTCDMTYSDVRCTNENDQTLIITGVTSPDEFDKILLNKQNYIYISSVVLRPDVIQTIGDFDNDTEPMSDWDYWLRVSKAHIIKKTPDVRVTYMWKSAPGYYNNVDMLAAHNSVINKHSNIQKQKVVVIAPFSQKLPDGSKNPKDLPLEDWRKIVTALRNNDIYTIQVGAAGEPFIMADEIRFNLSNASIQDTIKEMDTFISVDTFFQHAATYYGKKGIVIFSQSDPCIFGHSSNVNLLKDRQYLREQQFQLWTQTTYNKEAFVAANEVVTSVLKLLNL